MSWKIIGIICLVLLIVENLFLGLSYYLVVEEEEKTNECYYDICSVYPDASYEDSICYCYDYDVLGELIVVETEWMK